MKKSMSKKLIYDMAAISILPMVLILMVICILLCSNYEKEQKSQTSIFVSEFALRIENQIKQTEDISSSIMKYTYLTQNLTKSFEDNYERLDATMKVSSYLESVMGNNVAIYIVGDGVFTSKYILPLNTLRNQKEIYDNLSKTNLYWDNEIYSDSTGDYLLLYRKLAFNRNSILECKTYIPKNYTDEYKVKIVDKSKINEYNVLKKINENIYAVGNYNSKAVSLTFLLYFIIFLLLSSILVVVITNIINKSVKSTTLDIDNFIVKLKNNDLSNLDNIELSENSGEFIELEIIKKTIASLAKDIRKISYMKYEAELEKKKMELIVLQNKIDPHLLYNSLTVIKLDAIKNNEKNTIEIIDNLISYYRSVLAKGKNYASIIDEIEMLETFSKVNSIANSKEYLFTYNIEEKLKDKKIPHLILQPFVENSFVHGLSGRRKDCKIEIKVYSRNENNIVFEIFDNGYGMDKKQIDMLNDTENYQSGYGIKNVYMRLKLEYDNNFDVKFESEKNIYTKIILTIPNFE